MGARPVIFLSDFGEADEFAGVCRALIERLVAGVHVIDLAHGIPAGDVRRGALALAAAAGFAPPAVYLAVIDPGVGTERRAVALRAGRSALVGPDNGLLVPAAQALGGIEEAVDVSRTPVRLEPVSSTFHGRDVFTPVAAAIARGAPLQEIGEPIEPLSVLPCELPRPELEPGVLRAHVLYADGFGNLVLDARSTDLIAAGLDGAGALTLTTGENEHRALRGRTFADARDGLVLYDDSAGRLGLALAGASAERSLGLARDATVRIEEGA